MVAEQKAVDRIAAWGKNPHGEAVAKHGIEHVCRGKPGRCSETAKAKTKLFFGVGFLALIGSIVSVLAVLGDPRPQRALSDAVSRCDLRQARLAVFLGADVSRHPGGRLPNVVTAGWKGDVEMIGFLLSRGADVNEQCKFGNTALSGAVHNRQARAVEYLLAQLR